MSIEKNYPIGSSTENWPDLEGPPVKAVVTGYKKTKNLNTNETESLVCVRVYGNKATYEAEFAPSYAPFW